MGLPPRDPRSKSKNMAMKLINKIGNKQPKKQLQAPQYPGLIVAVAIAQLHRSKRVDLHKQHDLRCR